MPFFPRRDGARLLGAFHTDGFVKESSRRDAATTPGLCITDSTRIGDAEPQHRLGRLARRFATESVAIASRGWRSPAIEGAAKEGGGAAAEIIARTAAGVGAAGGGATTRHKLEEDRHGWTAI
jgi:hypothetical protein